MPSERKCPQCGAELPGVAPDAPCIQCLLGLGLRNPSPVPEGETVPMDVLPLAAAPDRGPAGTVVVATGTGQPGDRIGRYKLLQQIGEGGMGGYPRGVAG